MRTYRRPATLSVDSPCLMSNKFIPVTEKTRREKISFFPEVVQRLMQIAELVRIYSVGSDAHEGR